MGTAWDGAVAGPIPQEMRGMAAILPPSRFKVSDQALQLFWAGRAFSAARRNWLRPWSPSSRQNVQQPDVVRSERMSSLSEQEHLNPKDPLSYPPRLRKRDAAPVPAVMTPTRGRRCPRRCVIPRSRVINSGTDARIAQDGDPGVAGRFAAAVGVSAGWRCSSSS